MAASNIELARRDLSGLVLRTDPMRLRWRLDDLVSSDGHGLRLDFTASVRALSEPAEQRMLEEVFLASAGSVSADDVVAHFVPALRSAAAALCQSKAAEEWLSNGSATALADALRNAGKRIAFSCGLELLPPFNVEMQSPSLEQQRNEAMQRKAAEERAASQVQHFARATELLKQFESIRQSAPQLSPGEILRQLNPADQGTVLQTLLLAEGKQHLTQRVFAVAGPMLVEMDPRPTPPRAAVQSLPAELGPLRSVNVAAGGLLLGARTGVYWLAEGASTADGYADAGVTSPLGFNSAVRWNGQVWASHSEAGLVGWLADQKERPRFEFRFADQSGAGLRNLQVLDSNRLVLSTRNRVVAVQLSAADGMPSLVQAADECRSEIVAVLPEPRRLVVVLRDGTVQVRDGQSLAVQREERRSGPVSAATLMPWLGATRLLLASEDGPILCIGLEDDLVTQYANPFGGLRALAAGADLISAVSADRQRIVLWQPWNPRQPMADVYVPSLTRHRAADVAV